MRPRARPMGAAPRAHAARPTINKPVADTHAKHGEHPMAKFLIEPHFRLHEWVAEEKGYFRAEGLDYEFRELVRSSDGKHHDKGDKVGAYQSIEAGRKSNV